MGKALGIKKQGVKLPSASSDSVNLEVKKSGPTLIGTAKRLIIIILLISFAVYFNALFNGFVYDDNIQVLQNRWIKNIGYIPEIFSKSVWSFKGEATPSNYYRPMMHIIYMLNYHIFVLKPWGFHLVNILFHAGVSVLVFAIALKLLREALWDSRHIVLPAFIAAVLFATHPIHTEAVTWVAGLPDLSCTLFYLLSFYLYIRAGPADKLSYSFSVLSFGLATFCKEPALTLPFLIIAYDFTCRKLADRPGAYWKRYIPYLVVAGVYLILRFHSLGEFAPRKRHMALSLYQLIINIFPLLAQYVGKLLLPANLNAWHVFHPITSIFEMKGILSITIIMTFVILCFIAFKRNKIVFFSLVLIFLPLLPVLYIPGVGESTFAERYLYLPSFGFVMLAALFLQWSMARKSRLAFRMTIVLMALTIGIYSAATINRNITWRDNYSLWADTVKKSSDGYIPNDNLGNAYFEKGLIDQAIEHYQSALRLEPNYAEAQNNLGNAYNAKGLYDKAIEHLQVALRLNPKNSEAYNNLGNAYHGKGLYDKAIEHYQAALRLKPEDENVYFNLGCAYYGKGLYDKAIEHYQAALRLKPEDAEAHRDLGIIYVKKGLKNEAIREFKTALKINPHCTEASQALQSLTQREF